MSELRKAASMRFGSVCSGIEAASVAWHPLGWKAAWLAEIEPFPGAVLAHHYPDVPNLGDMTKLPELIASGEVEAPDLFCGGTPCQAFSIAGLRKSLDDARGNLSLTFCEIANAVDTSRARSGLPPCIVFWENVPGVLSTADNAFGCFLAGLAGEDDPIVPAGKKWTNAGVVLGPERAVAWRILDAQYFGVAQRRRRVFVVASSRKDFDPAAVLFEFDGVRRDFAPRREAGQKPAPTIAGCANGGGANGPGRDVDSVESLQVTRSHWDGDYPHPTLNQSAKGSGGVGASNQEIFSQRGAYLAPHPVVMSSGQANDEIRTDGGAPSLTCLHEAPIVTHTLRGEGFDASEDGTGRGTPLVPVAFRPTQDPIHSADVCHSLGANDNATAAVLAPTLTASNDPSRSPQSSEVTKQVEAVLSAAMQVRRLTPVECERLQGFPDNYTAIPWRKKPSDQCPDGPRYKALGNSWAVPVVRWIGARIQRAANDNSPTTKANHDI